MKVYLVTEGPADVAFLERLLKGRVINSPHIIAAGGKSAVTSFAQSLMVSRGSPVCILLDADTVDRQLVREQEQILVDRLAAYSHGVPFKVFLAVPEVEHLFFESPAVLKRELGVQISQKDAQEAAVRPRQVLERLLKKSPLASRQEFFASLSDDAVKDFARLPLVESLIAFLRRPKKPGMRSHQFADNVA